MEIKIFPKKNNFINEELEKQNLQIITYGRRIRNSQTYYEYLLEFLLVFIGLINDVNEEDVLNTKGFFSIDYDKPIIYKVSPNIALKRFIFFEKSKNDNRFNIDKDANNRLKELLKANIDCDKNKQDKILNQIRDLFIGFTAFSGERGWFAKSMLPVCKTTIFPEAMGKKKDRKSLEFYVNNTVNIKCDTGFEFKEHNFLARGGEVYFTHLAQGLRVIENEDKTSVDSYKYQLNKLLVNLIEGANELEQISNWILDIWYKELSSNSTKLDSEGEFSSKKDVKEYLINNMECKWISDCYERRAKYTVLELINLLKSEMDQVDKVNLLATAIVFQILNMMTEGAIIQSKIYPKPIWLIHVQSSSNEDKKTKKLAIEMYKKVEESMIVALDKALEYKKEKLGDDFNKVSGKNKTKTDITMIKEAYDDSHKLLRKLGKEIGLIIPLKGDNMRFTLSDNIIKFLVLSIVEPNSKMTLDTFIDEIYEHFNIVIGARQYNTYLLDNNIDQDEAPYLQKNLEEFQLLLRKNGFLKDLSDSTAIVQNPYLGVE